MPSSSTRRGAVAHRGDDFHELVADRHHRVLEAERDDARVPEGRLDAEHGVEVLQHRFELVCNERDLAKP